MFIPFFVLPLWDEGAMMVLQLCLLRLVWQQASAAARAAVGGKVTVHGPHGQPLAVLLRREVRGLHKHLVCQRKLKKKEKTKREKKENSEGRVCVDESRQEMNASQSL
jgi:hypothetical protein